MDISRLTKGMWVEKEDCVAEVLIVDTATNMVLMENTKSNQQIMQSISELEQSWHIYNGCLG
ncbi:hypothetical protein [Vibrio nigripulchritudo]|uniref:hypothetical protein n=1 Tax=Vibrio nigripulchritudo TaxID=28173 RepID=UPI0024919A07|nr:hypothetical protein [Vibrio nigripulchritudo]BDU36060.1 hypothetical protein TUMSATVNIG2_05290 [Vibrio nigripulchritudo]BDU41715.1 hypothetical protein TUMSATVNIG3_05130 [Vibrio nigripulchritudo]